MKVYISADIEGVAGICHWDETDRSKPDYPPFRDQMQREVNAACRGAIAAGADEILVNDAHDTGRNLDPADLPPPARLVREWSWDPFMMLQELDSSFDAVVMIGYHSGAGSSGSPLAHTYSPRFSGVRINACPVAEFHVNAWTGALVGVPTVFVSGDADLCATIREFEPRIRTVATNAGRGSSVIAAHPDTIVEAIEAGVKTALTDRAPVPSLPDRFELALEYADATRAHRASNYPGARLDGSRTVVIETAEWMDVLRALVFLS